MESTASPEAVLEAARDFSPRRSKLWRDVYAEHLTVHDRGATWADVTEGNPWPIGIVWERLHFEARDFGGKHAVCFSLSPASPMNSCVGARADVLFVATSSEYVHVTEAIQAIL